MAVGYFPEISRIQRCRKDSMSGWPKRSQSLATAAALPGGPGPGGSSFEPARNGAVLTRPLSRSHGSLTGRPSSRAIGYLWQRAEIERGAPALPPDSSEDTGSSGNGHGDAAGSGLKIGARGVECCKTRRKMQRTGTSIPFPSLKNADRRAIDGGGAGCFKGATPDGPGCVSASRPRC
jgi:hypothetical protein